MRTPTLARNSFRGAAVWRGASASTIRSIPASSWLALGALIAAGLLVVVAPPALPTVGLAGLATLLAARDPRLGPLGAGIFIAMALPFGRGADVDVIAIASVPIRPQDAAIGVAVLLALSQLRLVRSRWRPLAIIAGFLAVGVVATIVGLANDHVLRDILRDVRWWGLYAAFGLALLAAGSRPQIVRGILLGATGLAVVIIIAGLLPGFDGGLKAQGLEYDRGTLRMQFGNSILLLVALGWVTAAILRRPGPGPAIWCVLLVVAIVESLTRTSVLVMFGTIGVAVLMWLVSQRPSKRVAVARAAAIAVVVVVGFASGIGLATIGNLATLPGQASGPGSPGGESPIERITFQSDASDVESILNSTTSGGRLDTYRNAIERIVASPLVGAGMGSLVRVEFAYSQARAYTIGMQPGVDNAWLTVGLKAGIVGSAAFALLLLSPLAAAARRAKLRSWFVPAWLGILALTITQSSLVSGYAPFAVALLAAVPFLGYASRSGATAAAQV